MTRKKSSMQKEVERTEGLPFIGKSIVTTAIINQLTVGCHQDKISLTSFSLSGEDNEVITDMVKNERDVLLEIDMEVPDDNFPDIQVKGKLKGYKISKTCDAPDIINIQFSSGQVQQLTNYIRTEQQIKLTFLEAEPELDFEGQGQKDSDAEAA